MFFFCLPEYTVVCIHTCCKGMLINPIHTTQLAVVPCLYGLSLMEMCGLHCWIKYTDMHRRPRTMLGRSCGKPVLHQLCYPDSPPHTFIIEESNNISGILILSSAKSRWKPLGNSYGVQGIDSAPL